MKPKFVGYGSHLPVLYEAVTRTNGAVMECGCGAGSTTMLHKLCEKNKRRLLSLESRQSWIDEFAKYATPWHKFILVADNEWEAFLMSSIIMARPYDVALIDQNKMEPRLATVKALKDRVTFLVLHDCQWYPEGNFFGKSISKINGPEDTGLRTYDDFFQYYKEFFPPGPWPDPPPPCFGPPTLLASNFERCDWDIDFKKYEWAESLWR